MEMPVVPKKLPPSPLKMMQSHALDEFGQEDVHPIKFLTEVMLDVDVKMGYRISAATKLLDKFLPNATPAEVEVDTRPIISILGMVAVREQTDAGNVINLVAKPEADPE